MKSLIFFAIASLISFAQAGEYVAKLHSPVVNSANEYNRYLYFNAFVFKVNSNMWSSQNKPGLVNSILSELAINTTSTLRFLNLGADGTELVTEETFVNSAFSKILASNKNNLRMRSTWKLASCDGTDLNLDKLVSISDGSTVSDVIASFRKYDFQRYMSCTLKQTQSVLSERNDFLSTVNGELNLDLADTGEILMRDLSSGTSDVFYTEKSPATAEAQVIVEAAVQTFVKGVKGYGQLLVSVKDQSPSSRRATLDTYLSKNRVKLIESLNTIDQNISRVTAITWLSTMTTVRQGYAYVQAMEDKIGGTPNFDQIITNRP